MNEQAGQIRVSVYVSSVSALDASDKALSAIAQGSRVIGINDTEFVEFWGGANTYTCRVYYSIGKQIPLLTAIKENQNG